jgi:ribosomal-protein-alanine N-acetyltransferase
MPAETVFTLHRANAQDASQLAQLHASAFDHGVWNEDQISGSLRQPSTKGWIAYGANEPIGFVLYQIAASEAEILTICLKPDCRGKGFGSRLLSETMAMLGVEKIFLDVAADNDAALGLYRKTGFAEERRRSGYYDRHGTRIDAIVLSRKQDLQSETRA